MPKLGDRLLMGRPYFTFYHSVGITANTHTVKRVIWVVSYMILLSILLQDLKSNCLKIPSANKVGKHCERQFTSL